ncbi:MAG: hypothetical protein DRO94_02165 [Candidatus Altiarchaeales archaeon]|nr:MAG: hypothetical protein DRO95_00065 [Candidatus Altiarchaeales archaeon]RLI94759.1 MAG: hypothetical protein DRO94_02165 [Candidatus Altiarchaeales archaeon]HDO82804.1 hypothetical protein [Candidatus Altiarchaeales archaeon]HEX55453.1 hypothetical protein [Candidatus Altiarchaeales archaeon]
MPEEETEKVNPDRVGIRMDILENIIKDLNANEDLRKIFGVPVSRALVVVADNNDLRIEEGGLVELTEDQEKKFLEILEEIIRANMV